MTFQTRHSPVIDDQETNHQDISTFFTNIGNVYSDMGEYVTALKYHCKALKVDNELYGDKHSHIARTYMNIGNAYHELGEYTSALEYYNKSLDMYKAVFGTTNHPSIANVTHNILITNQYQNKSTN